MGNQSVPQEDRPLKLISPSPLHLADLLKLHEKATQQLSLAQLQAQAVQQQLIEHLTTVLRCAGYTEDYSYEDISATGEFTAVPIPAKQPIPLRPVAPQSADPSISGSDSES